MIGGDTRQHAGRGRDREQVRADADGQCQNLIINSWSGALPKEGQAGAALYASCRTSGSRTSGTT